jgi:hypothetical protein
MKAIAEKNERYTYKDYLTWDDGKRYELIRGVPHWIIDAENRIVHVNTLENGEYRHRVCDEEIEIRAAGGAVKLNVADVFAETDGWLAP